MSDVPKNSGLDPFCQRSSIEIAADVGAVAVRLLDTLELLSDDIYRFAHGGGYSFGGLSEACEAIATGRALLNENVDELGGMFDKVNLWWMAEEPPAIDPSSTSIVEAILRWSVFFLELQDLSRPPSLTALCRFVELKKPRHNLELFEPALWCEISAMARRPQPSARLAGMWDRVNAVMVLRPLDGLRTAARLKVSEAMPMEWDELDAVGREKLVDAMWAKDAPTVRPEVQFTNRQVKLLEALKGKAMKKDALAKSLGLTSPSNLYTTWGLKNLTERGTVKNDDDLGYYWNEYPPSELLGSQSRSV